MLLCKKYFLTVLQKDLHMHSFNIRWHKLIIESKHTCPTEQRTLLMPAELPNGSYAGLVLNFILFIWGELFSALRLLHLTPNSQETHCRQQIIYQKGREHKSCVLAEKGRRLLLQLFFTAISCMSLHPLPGAQVWAIPSTPACPFGPGSMASTKTCPSTDRKVNSKTLVYDKWIRTSIGLALILCLIPIIQDFQYKPD